MTREEALEQLRLGPGINEDVSAEYNDAVEIAIEALEHPEKNVITIVPCGDAISRQAVIEYIEGSEAELGHSSENEKVCQDIKEFPPVNPQEKTGYWIPVSERLPEDHKNVLIYLSSNQITIGLYNSHRLPFRSKPIGWGADAPHGWSSNEVVAWMPLPEPYEVESEEI